MKVRMGSLCQGHSGSFQREFEPFAGADAAKVGHSDAIGPRSSMDGRTI